jgi:hypothetical protein
MVTEIRWKDLIDEGQALIDILQREQFPLSGAFWVSNGTFRLVIASQLARDKGSIETYQQFLGILERAGLQFLDYTDVSILSPTDANYLDFFDSLYYKGSVTRNLKLGSYAYIYFLQPEAIPVAS